MFNSIVLDFFDKEHYRVWIKLTQTGKVCFFLFC